MITWPVTLPQSPLVRGYKSKRRKNTIDFQTDVGPAKVRRASTATPSDSDEPYILTKAQRDTLDNFFDNTLKSGTLEFFKVDPNTGQTAAYRILDSPEYTKEGIYYTTLLKMEKQP